MKKLGSITLAGVLFAASLWAVGLSIPRGAYACSCMATGPEQIGKYADDPSTVVFVGTVTHVRQGGDNMGHTFGTLAIHQIFKGELPAEVPVIGGGGGDCTIHIEVGQRMITAATFDRGAVTPGLCRPYGDPTTPEGQQLIDVAVRAYGPSRAPPDVAPDASNPPATPDLPAADLALPILLGIVVAAAVVLFGGIALLSRRGRRAT